MTAMSMDAAEITRAVLMYFILPLWVAAGFADYLCHRSAHIERTSGAKESLLHLVQFAEMGVPVLAAMLLEINALVILVMIVCFLLHEVTAFWDVSYASKQREISPLEQHVHSFLEMLPLMGLVLVIVLHWPQFISFFGLAPARFDLALKQPPLPWTYIASMLALVLLFDLLPLLEELMRGLRAARNSARARASSSRAG